LLSLLLGLLRGKLYLLGSLRIGSCLGLRILLRAKCGETIALGLGLLGLLGGRRMSLLGADFFGRVRYSRSFNCPTNLDPNERVWLVCEGVDGTADFTLNGTPIFALAGAERSGSCDITSQLRPQNQLTVDVTLLPAGHAEHKPRAAGRAGLGGGITGEVRLEIRHAAT